RLLLPGLLVIRRWEVPVPALRVCPDVELQKVLLLSRDRAAPRALLGPEIAQCNDRELEAFRPVSGHDPDDVVCLLGDGRFDLDRLMLHRVAQVSNERPEPS